jgi:hypothetical protein
MLSARPHVVSDVGEATCEHMHDGTRINGHKDAHAHSVPLSSSFFVSLPPHATRPLPLRTAHRGNLKVQGKMQAGRNQDRAGRPQSPHSGKNEEQNGRIHRGGSRSTSTPAHLTPRLSWASFRSMWSKASKASSLALSLPLDRPWLSLPLMSVVEGVVARPCPHSASDARIARCKSVSFGGRARFTGEGSLLRRAELACPPLPPAASSETPVWSTVCTAMRTSAAVFAARG